MGAAAAVRPAVAALCAYEAVACYSRLPTLTALAWRLRRSPFGRPVLAAACGGQLWLVWHLWLETTAE